MLQSKGKSSYTFLAKWCKSGLQVTGQEGSWRALGISAQARLGLAFCLTIISIKSPADSSITIQAGKSHSVLIKFDFFVTVFQTVSPQCIAVLHTHTQREWFNPLWLLQLQIVFTKLNRIHNWADILQSVMLSFSHSTAGKKSAEEAKQNNWFGWLQWKWYIIATQQKLLTSSPLVFAGKS